VEEISTRFLRFTLLNFWRIPSHFADFPHFFLQKLEVGRNHLKFSHFFVKFTKKKKLSKFCSF